MRKDIKGFVNEICRSETWDTGNSEERDLGYGVACMQAYLIGIKPTINDLSTYLEIDRRDMQPAFQRMLQCGLFSKAFNARGDNALNIKPNKRKSLTEILCAWGNIAGIAAGLVIRNYSKADVS